VWLQYPPWCVAVTIPSKKDVVAGDMTILDGDSIPLIPSSRTIEVDAKLPPGSLKRPPGSGSQPDIQALIRTSQTGLVYPKVVQSEPGGSDVAGFL